MWTPWTTPKGSSTGSPLSRSSWSDITSTGARSAWYKSASPPGQGGIFLFPVTQIILFPPSQGDISLGI